MNIYGDRGNIICLKKRIEWRGKKVVLDCYDIGMEDYDFGEVDLFFFGGGQDMQQAEVAKDIKRVENDIKEQVVERKAALLAVCGGMQLLARYYETKEGEKYEGAGIFDAYTVGGRERFIGNVVVKSSIFGEERNLVGFENHSGRTYANWEKVSPLGKVIVGRGNNGEDQTEGVVFMNAIGTYLHGCVLSKNPELADWLIQKAFERRYNKYILESLDDSMENMAKIYAMELAKKIGRVKNISEQ